jgi:hypothetical protein
MKMDEATYNAAYAKFDAEYNAAYVEAKRELAWKRETYGPSVGLTDEFHRKVRIAVQRYQDQMTSLN